MLIYSITFILLSNAASVRRDKSILFNRLSITALLYSAYLSIASLSLSLDAGIGLFGGLLHITSHSQIFHLFIFLITALILQLTAFYPRRVWSKNYSIINKLSSYNSLIPQNTQTIITNKNAAQYKILEYPLILLFIITGAALLVASSDLVSIFLSIELQSYGLYLVSTVYRNSELATSGGLTYFLLGGLSSGFILLGTSLLYANSGTTNLDGLYVLNSLSEMQSITIAPQIPPSNILYWYKPHYINMSLLILSVGFLFKLSAAPFHFWSPHVYEAIPTIVTTFVAIVAKISIFIFLLELVHYTSNSLFIFTSLEDMQFSWTSSLLFSSLLSLIVGSVVGLSQFRIKRLLAYSTISHVGFILLALSVDSLESIQAFIFYLMQYSISNLNAFIILISIGFSLYFYLSDDRADKQLASDVEVTGVTASLDPTAEQVKFDTYEEIKDSNNSPIELTSQMKGFFYINPMLALSFAITIFSFAGIPPLIGFFAKQMVLSASLDSGYLFITLMAILTSVVSGVYYLNIVKEIFFAKASFGMQSNKPMHSYSKQSMKINPDLTKLSQAEQENISALVPVKQCKEITGKPSQNCFSASNAQISSKSSLNKLSFNLNNVILSSTLTITISVLTLVILLFMLSPDQWLSMVNILALLIFNP